MEVLGKEEPWEETLHARKLARRAQQFAGSDQGLYYLDLHLRLPDLAVHPLQQLATQERMVARSPYLNARVMDLLTRLPMSSDPSKTHLLAQLAQLAQRYLPANTELVSTPLSVPLHSLLNIEGFDLLQQTLSPEALKATGIFEPGVVAELMKQGEVRPELLLVFTTQLFCLLFGIS